MPDLLKGIFERSGGAPKGQQVDAKERSVWPLIQQDEEGFVSMQYVDNDRVIERYEENLQDLVETFGMKFDRVSVCADGLAILYDVKAGLEKDAAHYDKALEYLALANKSREELLGATVAKTNPAFVENLGRIAKIQRKKERRLARGPGARPHRSAEELAVAPSHAPRVVEVRVSPGDANVYIEFFFEDGTDELFYRPGRCFPRVEVAENTDPFEIVKRTKRENLYEATSQQSFLLEDGEFLVGTTCLEKEGRTLSAIAFHTSRGRRSAWFEFDHRGARGVYRHRMAQSGRHLSGLLMDGGAIAVPGGVIESVHEDLPAP